MSLQPNGSRTRGCYCEPCMAVWRVDRRRRQKVSRMRVARGISAYVPATEAAELIAQQRVEHRLTTRRSFCQAAGIAASTYQKIVSGSQKVVSRALLRQLQELPNLDSTMPGQLPPGGTNARLGALAVAGYGVWDVAQMLGHRQPLKLAQCFVLTPTAEKILALTDEVVRQPGPRLHASKVARTRGWHAWDEYDQDLFWDLRWDGSGGLSKPLRGAELLDEYLFLRQAGVGHLDAAQRLGANPRTLEKAAIRHRPVGEPEPGPENAELAS